MQMLEIRSHSVIKLELSCILISEDLLGQQESETGHEENERLGWESDALRCDDTPLAPTHVTSLF